MAADFESPSKFNRGFQEFVLEGESTVRLETGGSAEIEAGLGTMMSCVSVLLRARDEGTVHFAEGVTARMFETMGVLLMRAAHASDKRRQAMFAHWQAHGPEIIEGLIASVTARQSRMLLPEELATAFMGTPPGY